MTSEFPLLALTRVPRDPGRAQVHPAEAALLGSRAVPKRRAEFAAGRLAARVALGAALDGRASGAAVLREPGTGRPRGALAGGAECGVAVSITHADGRAAAAVCPEPIGIDLVTIEPLEAPFAAEAFAAGELEAWASWLGLAPAGALDQAAAAAFAAKEAALKWLGTGLALPLQALRVTPACPPLPLWGSGAVALVARPGRPTAWLPLGGWRFRVGVRAQGAPPAVLDARLHRLGRQVLLLLWGTARPS